MKRVAVVAAAALSLLGIGTVVLGNATGRSSTCVQGATSSAAPAVGPQADGTNRPGPAQSFSAGPADCAPAVTAIPAGGAIGALGLAGLLGLMLVAMQGKRRSTDRRGVTDSGGEGRGRSG
jgi:hypothetical protein